DKQSATLHTVEESGRHLLALINDILDLSKIEAGKAQLDIEPVSVATVCQASLQFIKELAHKKRIAVSPTLDPTVTMVPADERRLKQMLVNLLSNAVKFTPEGGAIGLEVVVARNGAEALERADDAKPALILMDIQMPGMDGLEAIQRIRANRTLETVPIIALTALAMLGDRERCLAAGADEYLTKPVSLKGLVTTIEADLQHPATSGARPD